jgi:hypothetical protein
MPYSCLAAAMLYNEKAHDVEVGRGGGKDIAGSILD